LLLSTLPKYIILSSKVQRLFNTTYVWVCTSWLSLHFHSWTVNYTHPVCDLINWSGKKPRTGLQHQKLFRLGFFALWFYHIIHVYSHIINYRFEGQPCSLLYINTRFYCACLLVNFRQYLHMHTKTRISNNFSHV